MLNSLIDSIKDCTEQHRAQQDRAGITGIFPLRISFWGMLIAQVFGGGQ
jgi:hypothetical protein